MTATTCKNKIANRSKISLWGEFITHNQLMPTRCSVHILLDKTVTNKYLLRPPDMKCTAIWVKCGEHKIQDNQEQVLPEASSADCVLSTSGRLQPEERG